MVHNKAQRLNDISRGKKKPVCAASNNIIEVCVQETVVKKYRSGPLGHLQKLLLGTDLRLAAGVAVTVIAAWRFLQFRRRKGNLNPYEQFAAEVANEGLCHEVEVVAELEPVDTTWEELNAEAILGKLDNDEEYQWGEDGLSRSNMLQQDQTDMSHDPIMVDAPAYQASANGELAGKERNSVRLEERTHMLRMDLEESEAERKAAQDGLRAQGLHGRLLVAEAGSPVSSTSGTPLETSSPTSGDSPVAALLAKAKATSEKVDRIHERLRRLSKGDGPN